MSHPSKKKGNGFEREVVQQATEAGLKAERAWGSNGQSKGWHEEVDVMIEGLKFQCKRRASLGKIVRPTENVDAQIIREDHGKAYVVLPLSLFLTLIGAKDDAVARRTNA